MGLSSFFKYAIKVTGCFIMLSGLVVFMGCSFNENEETVRERISINKDWRFYKYGKGEIPDDLIYDVLPELDKVEELRVADAKPTVADAVEARKEILKPWILPSGNAFIKDSSKHFVRPEGNPGGDFPFVQTDFDDTSWKQVHLPHDWAIAGPFQEGWESEVGGGMGRLPVNGVAWYRKKLFVPSNWDGKTVYLDVDGAMAYAMVWLNGNLVGGWPYGYNSWRLDLTPYLLIGEVNQLAIRIDNPNHSARWYPGAGIYRNVWLSVVNPVHVAHWGTFISTQNVNDASARVKARIDVENKGTKKANIEVITKIFPFEEGGHEANKQIAVSGPLKASVLSNSIVRVEDVIDIPNPALWGPPPSQEPNLYLAVTEIFHNNRKIDCYETRFGIRRVEVDPNRGLIVNGEHIPIKGVNQHHDLGALGAAFNKRAAERQLEILREMGCNAIRMAHNPPAPELLELTDRMGFLVVDEVFDCWERKKTPHDFHLIFPEWHEQDLRAMVRRDKNCPSVFLWSFGNEVGEQYTGDAGATLAKKLAAIVKDEDPTRLTTASMNYARPNMPFPAVLDVISLNYQGEGIRQDPMFKGTDRIQTPPSYQIFHDQFPDKLILGSETASAMSSRGVYLFPVADKLSSPVRDGMGGDPNIRQVSSYELYAVDFGSSADKVFRTIEKHPFVAGEFVWNGFDYLGEPTPYYLSRSSYTGIVDLAGFKKDRFFLYQAHWRPDFPMVHILPHWNWPERIGKITPIHVFTSGDEVELFLNGKSLGRKKKKEFEYRLRWDNVVYQHGELKAVAYKNGKIWAQKGIKTTGKAYKIKLSADRSLIKADGYDLSFITAEIVDENGLVVPGSNHLIHFSIDGPGSIVATDNGNPTDMNLFSATNRNAFNGLALAIIQSKNGTSGVINVSAKSPELKGGDIIIKTQ
ncbi:beta-galactosidase GalB [Thermophagus sp. OGC60D27]|uniref:beta-galactosidase GalB n=1 Tax=Thermophagus sp. OGC60D27 TaxID=3458415 RepID=UPI004037BA0B